MDSSSWPFGSAAQGMDAEDRPAWACGCLLGTGGVAVEVLDPVGWGRSAWWSALRKTTASSCACEAVAAFPGILATSGTDCSRARKAGHERNVARVVDGGPSGESCRGSSDVRVRVFDVAGRLVKTLAVGQQPAGSWTLDWDGLDTSGKQVPSGVYYIRLDLGPHTETLQYARLQ